MNDDFTEWVIIVQRIRRLLEVCQIAPSFRRQAVAVLATGLEGQELLRELIRALPIEVTEQAYRELYG